MSVHIRGSSGVVQDKAADTYFSKAGSSLMQIHDSLMREYLDTVMGYTKWNHFVVAANKYEGADKVNVAKVIHALDKLGLVRDESENV
jgi:hypothetical protein